MPSTAPIKVPINGIDNYSKEFASLTQAAKGVGTKISSLGQSMTAGITVPVAGMGAASVVMARKFNKGMADVATLIPGQTERLNKLKGGVLDLAASTGVAGDTIQKGLYDTLSAFGTLDSPMKKLELLTKMSKAGGATVGASLALVSSVTKGYGDTSDAAAQQVADLAFQTVKAGQTTFPELAASIGDLVPAMAAMKVSQQELFGSYATLTGVTGNASKVTTQLNALMQGMAKPTKKLTRLVKKHGFASVEDMVAQEGLVKTMEAVKAVAGGSSVEMYKLFKSSEAVKAALTLTGGQAEQFVIKTDDMSRVTGVAGKAFVAQTEGIDKAGFAYDKMIENGKRAAIMVGDRLLPIATELIQVLMPLIDKITNASDASIKLGIQIAAAAAIAGPIIMVIGKITAGAASAAAAIGAAGGLAGVLAMLTGPVGIAIAVTTAWVAVILYAWEETEAFRMAIVGPFMDAFEALKGVFDGAGQVASSFGSTIKTVVGAVSTLIAPLVKLYFKLMLLPFHAVIRVVRIAVQVFRIVASVVKIFVNAVKFAWHWIGALVDKFLQTTTLGQGVAKVFDFIGKAVHNVWKYVQSLWDEMEGFFVSIADWLDTIGVEMESAAEKQRILRSGGGGAGAYVPLDTSGIDKLDADKIFADIKEQRKTESTVKIEFDNLPPGATPKVTSKGGAELDVSDNGAVMSGGL